jgi:hypothetical protein
MRSDPGELMDSREAADNGVIFDMDMSAEGGDVGHDNMIIQFAVMGNMSIRHQHIVIANNRHADIGAGGTVDSGKFPDYVEVADDHAGLLAAELQILRRGADRAELKDAAAFAYMGVVIDYGMRADYGIFADLNIGADY